MLLRQQVRAAIETAAKVAAVPTDKRAIKLINYLKKHYSAKPIKNYSSNPYDNVQALDARLTTARGNKFIKELQDQGWAVKQKKFSSGKDYQNSLSYDALYTSTGAHISIIQYDAKDVMSKKASCTVRVFGNKRAKPSTIPYYD